MMISIKKIKYFCKFHFVFCLLLFSAITFLTGCENADKAYVFEKESETGEDNEAKNESVNKDVSPERAEEGNDLLTGSDQPGNVEKTAGEPEVVLLCVYVCGEVNEPGVYCLPENSRVCDALDMAGGMTEEADETSVNLAGFLNDGEMLFFPKKGESGAAANSQSGSDADALININTGSVNDLMSLPGIGESRAKDIIAYREQNGYFLDTKDIMKVSGIKESVYNKIKDHIKVN
ncbi:MAG: helix-hairpin-helix domain-containing protein [Acetatifactor sp.]|nr:helix-hairpin-helix domain-containing protein [Acetatifactor sp.]